MKLLRRIRAFFLRDRLDAEMREEMRLHLDAQAARHRAAGLSPDEARYAAQRQFGNVASLQERAREISRWCWLEHLGRDVRFALRGLRRSPGFAAVGIGTIAIAIGAGSSVFSVVNAILLRSLAVPNPQELRALHWSGTGVRMRSFNGNTFGLAGEREVHDSVNHPIYLQLRERAAGIADVFGYFPLPGATMVASAAAFPVDGVMVTDNFFSGLGLRPYLGRLFRRGDDAAARPEIVLSHALWQRDFASDPAVLGRTVAMRGTSYTVIGVLPPGFGGINPGKRYDFYISLAAGSPFLYVPLTEDWHWFMGLMARLAPGHGDSELEAALSPVFAAAARPLVTEGRIESIPAAGGLEFDRDLYGRPLRVMLGVTVLVTLLACANLAGLSLSRGVARTHELAVRAALGAHWRRLAVQSLVESAVLAVIGGAVGALLAVWGREAVSRLLAGSPGGLDYDLSLDARALAFEIATVTLTALLTGVLPALRAGRADPQEGLRGRGAMRAGRQRTGRALVVAQLCGSLSILTAAGMGLHSLASLRTVDPGFQTENLVTFRVSPMSAGIEPAKLVDFYARVQVALNSIPGASSVSVMEYVPLSGTESSGGLRFNDDGAATGAAHWTNRQAVGEAYFSTLDIPIRRGRPITGADTTDAAVKACVVNETFVRRNSPDRDPLGRTFAQWGAEWRIVGICADTKLRNLKDHAEPIAYFAFPQYFHGRHTIDNASYVVRSILPAAALRRPLEQAVASVSPVVPLAGYTTVAEVRDSNVGRERMLAVLCATLAAVALVLCCAGLYGLIAGEVSRRTSEIAIRLAIGARPADVGRPILGEALALAGVGCGLGLPLALGIQQILRGQFYASPPSDPLLLLAVVALLLAVAVVAAWVPVRRAMKVDPQVALRAE